MLKNARHEKFAQLVAGGMSATKAYKAAGYKAKDADVAGPRLLGTVGVSKRIAELKGKVAEKLEMTRADLAAFLVEVIQTPAGSVTPGHRLCQSVKPLEFGTEIRIPDKLGAAAQLAKLCGWNEPEKQDIGGDGLQQLIAAIRARR